MKPLLFVCLAVSLCCFSISARADLLAADKADNDPYPLGWNPGDNGGFGFTGWTVLESGTPGSMYTTTAIGTGTYSWGLSGTYALGRGLATATNAGDWRFLASHDVDNTAFSGFNLRSSTNIGIGFSTDELLRFGVDPSIPSFDNTGIYFSTNAGTSYGFLDLGDSDLSGATLQYEVEWRDSGAFILSVTNLGASGWGSYTGSLGGSHTVAMFGSAVYGASSDESVTFDEYNVTAIPEPGVIALGLVGLGLLLVRCVRTR